MKPFWVNFSNVFFSFKIQLKLVPCTWRKLWKQQKLKKEKEVIRVDLCNLKLDYTRLRMCRASKRNFIRLAFCFTFLSRYIYIFAVFNYVSSVNSTTFFSIWLRPIDLDIGQFWLIPSFWTSFQLNFLCVCMCVCVKLSENNRGTFINRQKWLFVILPVKNIWFATHKKRTFSTTESCIFQPFFVQFSSSRSELLLPCSEICGSVLNLYINLNIPSFYHLISNMNSNPNKNKKKNDSK